MIKKLQPITIILTSILIIAGVLFLYNYKPFTSSDPPFLIGGDFELIDDKGNIINQEILKNKYTLVYFGFTYCTDICPITLDIIAETIESFPRKDQEKIEALFITLDPERDNPKVLNAYLSNYTPFVKGATGSNDQIQNTAKKFLVHYNKIDIPQSDNYDIGHSGYIYLMNKKGEYLKHFDYDITPSKLRKELKFFIK